MYIKIFFGLIGFVTGFIRISKTRALIESLCDLNTSPFKLISTKSIQFFGVSRIILDFVKSRERSYFSVWIIEFSYPMLVHIMSNSSDSVISEILKLYDVVDEHTISNPGQQLYMFESDNAIEELSCMNYQVKEFLRPQKLFDNSEKSCN